MASYDYSTSESDTAESDTRAIRAPGMGRIYREINNSLIYPVENLAVRTTVGTVPKPSEYITYIPYWSDPLWDDEHVIVHGGPNETEDRVVVISEADKLRPALLPMDTPLSPTPYAKRWGIHPDRQDGRSCLSPTLSDTRRVSLMCQQETPTGFKDFITIQDVNAAIAALPKTAQRQGPQAALFSRVNNLAERKNLSREQVAAFRQLEIEIEQDHAYQRLMFNGMTTDDLIKTGTHSLDNDTYVYDLNTTIHPLLKWNRWAQFPDAGKSPEHPKYRFNLKGVQGDWDVTTCKPLRGVVKPALQIATEMLNSNHPYWIALLDVRSRKLIEKSRLPPAFHNMNWNWFSSFFDPTKPRSDTAPILSILESQSFDLLSAVVNVLMNCLWLRLGKGTSQDNHSGALGTTHSIHSGDPSNNATITSRIGIQISIEIVWPLLVDDFTDKEKAAVHLLVAETILHELAHAVFCATEIVFKGHSGLPVPRYVPDTLRGPVEDLGNMILFNDREPDARQEPYYGIDEPLPETGHAFTNQLLGGDVLPLHELDHFRMYGLSLYLRRWPHSDPQPHENNNPQAGDPERNRSVKRPGCPVSVHSLGVPLRNEDYSKYFRRSFWDQELKRYGHSALKLEPAQIQQHFPLLQRQFYRLKDHVRTFGSLAECGFLSKCINKISALGLNATAAYLKQCRDDALQSIYIRKQWHWEKKLWVHRMNALVALFKRGTEHATAIHNLENGITYVPSSHTLSEAVTPHVLKLLSYLGDIHRHLLFEIRRAQVLYVDYASQDAAARAHLWSLHGGALGDMLGYYSQGAITQAEMIGLKHWTKVASLATPDARKELAKILTDLEVDMNHMQEMRNRFLADANNVTAEKDPGPLFTLAGHEARKHKAMVKTLAEKEILNQPPVVANMVEAFLKIVNGARLRDITTTSGVPQPQSTGPARKGSGFATAKNSQKAGHARAASFSLPFGVGLGQQSNCRPWTTATPPINVTNAPVFGQSTFPAQGSASEAAEQPPATSPTGSVQTPKSKRKRSGDADDENYAPRKKLKRVAESWA